MKKTAKILLIMTMIILVTVMSEAKVPQINNINIETNIEQETEIKDSMRLSTYNSLLKASQSLEEEYNLKDNLNQINVKNQGNSQACWAFSFSSVLETSIAKQYNRISKEYSPMHIEYMTSKMFNRELGSGAGPRLSVAYTTSGKGPVEEKEMPFEDVYSEGTGYKPLAEVGNLDKEVSARVLDTKEFSPIYKEIEDGQIQYYKSEGNHTKGTNQYTNEEVEVNRNAIKEHIKQYGAVSADMHISASSQELQKYYKEETGSFNFNNYTNVTPSTSNHVVALVGWDDNYDKNNFNENSRPINNGAYIALNSYGAGWGNDGYFYISYEDACIETGIMGIQKIEEYEDEKDYDKLYQHDELGMNLGLPIKASDNVLYAAAKYNRTNEGSKTESITEVGVYIATASKVDVYINAEDDEIQDATIRTTSDTLETGYHVIKLPRPVELTGEKFAIKIKYTSEGTAQIPLEVNYKEYGASNTSDFFDGATANDDECYISEDGNTWMDINKTTLRVEDGTQTTKTHSLKNSSACIKAFSTLKDEEQEQPSGNNTSGGNTTGNTSTGNNTSGGNTSGNTNSGNNTSGGNTSGNTSTGNNTSGGNTSGNTNSGNNTSGGNTSGNTNSGNNVNGGNASGGQTGDNKEDATKANIIPGRDSTTAKGILPYTGQRVAVLMAIATFIVLAGYIFVKIRKLKDIK